MTSGDLSDRLGDPRERIGSVDHGCDFAGLGEPSEGDQIGSVLRLDGRSALLAYEHGHDGCLDHPPELTARVSPTVG